MKKTASKKKKVSKPNMFESITVRRRLQAKYPDMMNKTGGWVEKLGKKIKKEMHTQRTKSISEQLGKAGITDTEVKRLRNKQ